jgi:serine/threonine-protein kinase
MASESPHHEPEWLSTGQPSLGRYVLGPVLGQGGAGEVREAWDVVLCRTVALKVLRKMEPVGLIRFMHEAQVQSRIVHPHICHVYDVDTSGGVPKIAMQLVRGPTLAQAAEQLTIAEVVTLMAQVAEAVHAAHRLHLIHRDLKPSNILLERGPEQRWVPFVCDFGLAMALDEPSLTLGPGILGTPAFMAPEQLLGDRRRVGPATDVYSLGVTLHFALFGAIPSPDPERKGPPPLPRQGVFPPWRSKNPDLPADLATILAKCLEPAPEHRYPSALALAEDLWRFAQGAPIHAHPVGRAEMAWRRFRPYRLPAVAALLLISALFAGRMAELERIGRENRLQVESALLFELESADLEKELRLEKMLPTHDMRPAYARVHQRLATIRTQMAALEHGDQAPAHFALGRGYLLLRDFPSALTELQTAWQKGFRTADSAWMLARALVGCQDPADRAAIFATGERAPGSAALVGKVESLLRIGESAQSDMDGYARCLLSYVKADYLQAARDARASFLAHPWRYEAAAVEAFSLSALGQARYDAGDLEAAARHWQAAMDAAQRFRVLGQSDDFTQHAYFSAAIRLSGLRMRQGRMSMAAAERLQSQCANVLVLDPGRRPLLGDWLQFSILRARLQLERGRDARPILREALGFMASQVAEPLPVDLRADRMQLHWLMAQADLAAGHDPAQELDRALADLGHTRVLAIRDYYGDVLNFKARLEAARGQDPRPTLAAVLTLPAGPGAPWTQNLTVAEGWLLQAQWEAEHRLEARASLGRSRILVEQALAGNKLSSAAHTLKGLGEMLEWRLAGGPNGELLRDARGQFELARGLDAPGSAADRPREPLAGAPMEQRLARFRQENVDPF